MKRFLLPFLAFVLAFVACPASAAKPAVVELQPGQSLPDVQKGKILVIDFNASWCGPCRVFAPTFDKVAREFSKKGTFVSVNIDQFPELARSFNVRSIPCVVVLRDGKEPMQQIGMMPYDDFRSFVQQSLK